MARTVVGFFDDFSHARAAVEDLVNSGIPRECIGLTASNARGEHGEAARREGQGNKAGEGAAAGAGIGAVVGGLGGLLVGLGMLAIPGIGPILAAGPIATTLAGAGIGAATGGLIGALTGMGIPEEHAQIYAEGVRRGGTLVTVQTEEARVDSASDILNRHGAVDIERRAEEWRGSGWTGFRHDAQPMSREDLDREREVRVPVTEETLAVGKRPVERGGVRVYSRVEEQPVREDVQLREEHVSVDRRPVDRPITAGDRDAFQERSYEVREMAEEPVVSKQARVAEEVVIRKDVDERTETVSDTVRRTDVDVQPISGRDYSAYDQDFRRDFTTRFGTQRGQDYDSYEPAYRAGFDFGSDPRYASREWDATEADLRADWERRNAGPWERFKDSIRYGWDRARGGRRMDRAA
jgi:uncharacterized protein (TIGR02271 family)